MNRIKNDLVKDDLEVNFEDYWNTTVKIVRVSNYYRMKDDRQVRRIWEVKVRKGQGKCVTVNWQQSYRKKNMGDGNELGKRQEKIKLICV